MSAYGGHFWPARRDACMAAIALSGLCLLLLSGCDPPAKQDARLEDPRLETGSTPVAHEDPDFDNVDVDVDIDVNDPPLDLLGVVGSRGDDDDPGATDDAPYPLIDIDPTSMVTTTSPGPWPVEPPSLPVDTAVGWRAELMSDGEARQFVPSGASHSLRLAAELDGALPRVSDTLQRQIDALGPSETIELAVVPVFADAMVKPALGSPSAYRLVLRAPAGSPGLGAVDIPFIASAPSGGCGSLALSLWDAAMTRAMDSLLLAIPIGSGPEALEACLRRFGTAGGIVAGNEATFFATPAGELPASPAPVVGLHAFEFAPPAGNHVNYVVFAHRAPGSDQTIIGWQAEKRLSDAIDRKQFEQLLAAAHESLASSDKANREKAYQYVSRLMHRLLFTAATPAPAGQGPQDAFRLLQDYINSADAPTVSARFSIRGTAANDLMYVPLKLLAWPIPGYLGNDEFGVVQPLERPGADVVDACISKWNLLVPRKLDGISGESRTRLEEIHNLPDRPWIGEHASDTQAFFDFLTNASEPEPDAQPEGLILLSHYRREGLDPEWNAGNESAPPVIPEAFIERRFPRGSVAFLAACETAAPDAADGLIDTLNANGIDSVVASPFSINANYAINLTRQLLFELDKAYSAGDQPTLRQLLDRAASRTAGFYPDNERMVAKQSLELVLAGNPDIRICAPQGGTP